jgi:hypothetical protein
VLRTLIRRYGAVGVAITAYDAWRRIPPRYRAELLAQTRKHAPTVGRLVRETVRKGRDARASRKRD